MHVVHGEAMTAQHPTAVVLSQSGTGQAVAVALDAGRATGSKCDPRGGGFQPPFRGRMPRTCRAGQASRAAGKSLLARFPPAQRQTAVTELLGLRRPTTALRELDPPWVNIPP